MFSLKKPGSLLIRLNPIGEENILDQWSWIVTSDKKITIKHYQPEEAHTGASLSTST